MDKGAIENRLAELRKKLEEIQANGNALIGAIQDCEYWLASIETSEQLQNKNGEDLKILPVMRQ